MKLAKVPRVEGERVRRELSLLGGVEDDHKIVDDGEYVLIPLKEGIDERMADQIGFEIIAGELPSRCTYRSPMEQILAEVEIEEDLKEYLPRKWELLGDVLVMRFPEPLENEKEAIATKYAEVLGAKTVCEEVDTISGTYRTPNLEVLIGQETETVHKENGVLYKMDVSEVMFSSGNIDERVRVAELDCESETIVDMFAGIGYFSLPLAVHGSPSRVFACEINPVAYHYLNENIALNGVEGTITPIMGDNRDFQAEGIADRVLMGYVDHTERFLPKALELVREGGVVHYHNTFPTDSLEESCMRDLHEYVGNGHEVLRIREIKSYAPGISHAVIDFRYFE